MRLSYMVDKTSVKVMLVCLWVPATMWLAFLPIWAAYMEIEELISVISGSSRKFHGPVGERIARLALEFCALWSLAAVWLRIFSSTRTIQRRPFFWTTALGLAAGTTVIGAILVLTKTSPGISEPLYWAFLVVELLGILLLAGTVGLRACVLFGVAAGALLLMIDPVRLLPPFGIIVLLMLIAIGAAIFYIDLRLFPIDGPEPREVKHAA